MGTTFAPQPRCRRHRYRPQRRPPPTTSRAPQRNGYATHSSWPHAPRPGGSPPDANSPTATPAETSTRPQLRQSLRHPTSRPSTSRSWTVAPSSGARARLVRRRASCQAPSAAGGTSPWTWAAIMAMSSAAGAGSVRAASSWRVIASRPSGSDDRALVPHAASDLRPPRAARSAPLGPEAGGCAATRSPCRSGCCSTSTCVHEALTSEAGGLRLAARVRCVSVPGQLRVFPVVQVRSGMGVAGSCGRRGRVAVLTCGLLRTPSGTVPR